MVGNRKGDKMIVRIMKRLVICAAIGFVIGLVCLQAWIWIYEIIDLDMGYALIIAAPITGAILLPLLGYLADKETNESI